MAAANAGSCPDTLTQLTMPELNRDATAVELPMCARLPLVTILPSALLAAHCPLLTNERRGHYRPR